MSLKKILFLLSNKSQIPDVLKQLDQLEDTDKIIIISTTSDVNASVFKTPEKEIVYYHISQFINLNHKTIDNLAKKSLEIQNSLSEVFDNIILYRNIPLLTCFIPVFAHRYILPAIQGAFGLQKAIVELGPDEIWLTSLSNRKYFAPIFIHSGPALLNYNLLYPHLCKQIANQNGIPQFTYNISAGEMGSYLLSRYFRPLVFQLYKAMHWVKKKAPFFKSSNKQNGTTGFYMSGKVHKDRLLPIAEQLGIAKSKIFVDSTLTLSGQSLDINEGLSIAGRWEYMANLWSVLWGISKIPLIRRTIRSYSWKVDGIDLSEMLEAIFKSHIIEFDEIVTYVKSTQKLIKKHNLKVMVTANDATLAGQAIVRASHQSKVPTLLIQHGIFADPPLMILPISSKIAVFGENTKKQLIKWGTPVNRIKVTGFSSAIQFPSIVEPSNEHNHNDLTVTILPGAPADADYFVTRTVKLAEKIDAEVILKLHPFDPWETYYSLLTMLDSKKRVKLAQKEDIKNILQKTNLLISNTWSTVVLEAMALQIPVILLEGFSAPAFDLIINPLFNELKIVKSSDSLFETAQEILFNPSIKALYLSNQTHYAHKLISQEGNTASYIIDIINDLSQQPWSEALDTISAHHPQVFSRD